MCNQEKSLRISKVLRIKAQEFLTSRKYSNNLVHIIRQLEAGSDLPACLLTLELIFTTLLKDGKMVVNVIPLKPVERNQEYQYKAWLRNLYEESFAKILNCCDNESPKVQLQALSTAMCLLCYEGKYPLEAKGALEHYVPLNRLKCVLMKVLSIKRSNGHLIVKFEEYLNCDDVLFFTWKVLPSLTAKSNPNDVYILNYLLLLEKLNVQRNSETKLLCYQYSDDSSTNFTYDESATRRCLNKIWHCVMLWEHTSHTHKKLLIILLERVLQHLDKPLLLTDFLMDSLDMGGPVGLLALQGIFTLIQAHNLDYPDIFAKLYSMFEPEIFHTKFKARLFYLSDLFMRSTHLPENLVAAFAKRLARLALVAPSEDVIIICMFIGNLILRHPGLKSLLNYPGEGTTLTDPYIMEERDPVKSYAIGSSLWEIKTLQNHVLPSVATAARFINSPLPSIEWDLSEVLDNTGDDIFDKEVKKISKVSVLDFDRPNGFALNNKVEKLSQYWAV